MAVAALRAGKRLFIGGAKQDSHVKTVISRADGARIKAAWRLRTDPAGPKVIEVEDTHEVIATVKRFTPESPAQ